MAELRRLYEEQPKWRSSDEDISRWCRETSLSKPQLFDSIGSELAFGFSRHELDFSFCDWVVNSLPRDPLDVFRRNWITNGLPRDPPDVSKGKPHRPSIFEQVYLAFDAGEYYRRGKRHESPSEVYTRPLIEDIVRSLEATSRP